MRQFAAVTWAIKPGTASQVAEAFQDYPELDVTAIYDADGAEIGRVAGTVVFLKDLQVVRVIEFEGQLDDVIAHMATQSTVQQIESRLAPYLAVPRDTSTPEKFREFFLDSSMSVLYQAHEANKEPEAGMGPAGHCAERRDRLRELGRQIRSWRRR